MLAPTPLVAAADPQRLTALAAGCRRRAEQSARWRGGAAIARRLFGPPGHGCRRFTLRSLTPGLPPRHRRVVGLRAELATAGLSLLADVDLDPAEPARLLADVQATLARVDWSVFSPRRPRPAQHAPAGR